MGWLYLFLAGLFEIAFTTALRYTDGFSRPWPTLIFLLSLLLSLYLVERSIREIPLGTAYAVWTGIGAGGTAILGMLVYGETVNVWRILFILTLIGSIVGLKLVSD
jgi:quaternary ammonium compound-resistance protein SugE